MKTKVITSILVLIIITPMILAFGNSKTLYFNEDDEEIFYYFPLKDKVEFELLNKTQIIILDEIYEAKEGVDLDIFINGEEATYVSLKKNNYAKIDVNKDKKEDFEIQLIRILDNQTAKILFHKIGQNNTETNETNLEIITGETIGPKIEKTPNYIIGIAISLIIIISLLIIRQIYNSKKNKA